MKPVSSLAELDRLDQDSIVAGYRDGLRGHIDTTRMRDESYMHGMVVGQSDFRGNPTPAQRQLAAEYRKANK